MMHAENLRREFANEKHGHAHDSREKPEPLRANGLREDGTGKCGKAGVSEGVDDQNSGSSSEATLRLHSALPAAFPAP